MGSVTQPPPPWTTSQDGRTLIRPLSTLEGMFHYLNESMAHQTSPFLSASLEVTSRDGNSTSDRSLGIPLSLAKEKAQAAFEQTRYQYPLVASQISQDGRSMVYPLQSAAKIAAWAERCVHIVSDESGVLPTREEISREQKWPTEEGDYCVIYLVYAPSKLENKEILSKFELLIRFHHTFVDGNGARIIMHEFLKRFVNLDKVKHEIVWGDEVARLLPNVNDVLSADELEATQDIKREDIPEYVSRFMQEDAGLTLHRPDILAITNENRGSSYVTYTFEDPDFLQRLLQKCRQNGAKLTAVLFASLFKVVYQMAPVKPLPASKHFTQAAIDARTPARMNAPYRDRNFYPHLAAVSEFLTIDNDLVKTTTEEKDSQKAFWTLVASIAVQFSELAIKKGIVSSHERRLLTLVPEFNKLGAQNTNKSPPRPQTIPQYTSDPPGSKNLDELYPFGEGKDAALRLLSYQLTTEQNMAKISVRSHSWLGKLSLCAIYNVIRIPKSDAEMLLTLWARDIESLITGE